MLGPQHEFLTGNGDTPYGAGDLDLKADGPMVIDLPPGNFIGLVQDHNMRGSSTWALMAWIRDRVPNI
jgi:hypothetical protein